MKEKLYNPLFLNEKYPSDNYRGLGQIGDNSKVSVISVFHRT